MNVDKDLWLCTNMNTVSGRGTHILNGRNHLSWRTQAAQFHPFSFQTTRCHARTSPNPDKAVGRCIIGHRPTTVGHTRSGNHLAPSLSRDMIITDIQTLSSSHRSKSIQQSRRPNQVSQHVHPQRGGGGKSTGGLQGSQTLARSKQLCLGRGSTPPGVGPPEYPWSASMQTTDRNPRLLSGANTASTHLESMGGAWRYPPSWEGWKKSEVSHEAGPGDL